MRFRWTKFYPIRIALLLAPWRLAECRTSGRNRSDFAQRLMTRHPIEAQAPPTILATPCLPTSRRSRYGTGAKTLFNTSGTLNRFNILSGLQTNWTHFAAARPTRRISVAVHGDFRAGEADGASGLVAAVSGPLGGCAADPEEKREPCE